MSALDFSVSPSAKEARPVVPLGEQWKGGGWAGVAQTLPSVAVCLAAWNGGRWLQQQLDSILDQSGVNVTIFVSVDRSSDGTEAWVDGRAACDRRVVALAHGDRFGGAARNFFRLLKEVDFSRFDYVSLADQDDIWFPSKLSRAVEQLQQQRAQGYSSDVTAFWPSGRKRHITKSQRQRKWDYLFEAAGPGCTYVMTSDLVRKMQGVVRAQWDEVQEVALHDWFIYAFARTRGHRWVIDEQPGLLYRQHGNNQVGANVGSRAFFHRVQKVLSGWAFEQATLIARLVGAESDPFVYRTLKGGPTGLLRLALHSSACRRRRRDQVFFFVSCLLVFLRRTVACRHR